MNKSELIERIASQRGDLSIDDIHNGVNIVLDEIAGALAADSRVEVRGFGSFSVHAYPPRTGRNPKTGEQVEVSAKSMPRFKAGKELREQVDMLD